MVKRICKESGRETSVEQKKETDAGRKTAGESTAGFKVTKKEIAAALLCCLVDFGIAQFGLLTLIQKAYSGIAYLAIP